MTTTLREFQRNFGRMRAAAAAGKVVHIMDVKSGQEYIFKATKLPAPKTFGELAAHHCGAVDTGIGDLSWNKKHMKGYGRR